MANIIDDDEDIFDAYTYGAISRRNLSFLREQSSRVAEGLSDIGRRFADRLRKSVEEYDSEKIERGLRAIRDRLDRRWDDDIVRDVIDLADLQQAKPKLSRWLAANPRLRRERLADRAHGWRDNYIDYEPDCVGERQTDYRHVMNGIGVINDQDEVVFTKYLDVMDEEGDTVLSFAEQVAVLRGWERTNDLLDENYSDPSDPNNGYL